MRHRVSVFIPTFNREDLVAEAIQSILTQDIEEAIEIIIIDDASTDRTAEVIEELLRTYSGKHKVVFVRSEENKGFEQYNELIRLAAGEFIVVAHSDDIAEPHRVRRLFELYQTYGIGTYFSNAMTVDGDGNSLGLYVDEEKDELGGLDGIIEVELLIKNPWNKHMLGATMAFHRAILEDFPPIDGDHVYSNGEDSVFGLRGALIGVSYYHRDPLVKYRVHQESLTGIAVDSGSVDMAITESAMTDRMRSRAVGVDDIKHLSMAEPTNNEFKRLRFIALDALAQSALRQSALKRKMIKSGQRQMWITEEEYRQRLHQIGRTASKAKIEDVQ